MSEEKKYVTFRDLRAVAPAQKPPEAAHSSISTSTGLPSITSTTSIVEETNQKAAISPSISSSSRISRTPSSTSTSSATPRVDTKPQKDTSDKTLQGPLVAPERDFQRVPNSVTRKAIPEGLFRGKSKHVWDYLWSVTRGAVVPVRSTRKSRREIKAGSGLGSMVTVDVALEHLESVGLIGIKPAVGSLAGNEYEVFSPDEASTSIASIASTPRITQNLDVLDVLESGSTRTTQTIENTGGSGQPNTSFKTKDRNTDDEAFAEFTETVKKTAKEITGKEPSYAEAARWGEVAEVLMTELRLAAGRTTISSVPAFLAEHLRRRLWKKEKRQIEAEATEQKSFASTPKVDASKCPDCFGTGMYYPEGFDKGVAKCPHSKLTAESMH